MSEYIEVGQPLQFTDPNTPTRVGEIVENVSDIYNIPSPRLGMQVFVKNEKKSFVITSLKSKTIGGVDVPEAAVEAFEPVGAKSFTWNNDTDPSNMNDFVVAGVYDIKGEHTREDDNLPILNTGGGHTFNARLTVLDSSITGSGNSDDKCITQVLSFCNRLGQGEVYIRTGKGSSLDSLTWEKWSALQRNVNVGQVDNLDNLKDNGIYSGVWTKGSYNAYPLTFVCIVINDYFVGVAPRRISQFVYGLSKFDGSTVYQSRVWDDSKNAWSDWEILNQKKISSMISAEIKKVTDGIDPNKIDSLKDIITWIEEHGGDVTAIYNAIQGNTIKINAEVNRAQAVEASLGEYISHVEGEVSTINANLAETKKSIASSLHASSVADSVNITGKSDVGRTTFSAEIPAATTEKAGVMSAEDKRVLNHPDGRYIQEETKQDNLIAYTNKYIRQSDNELVYINDGDSLPKVTQDDAFDTLYIKCKPNTQYSISKTVIVKEYDKDFTLIQRNNLAQSWNNVTFTTSAETAYIRIQTIYGVNRVKALTMVEGAVADTEGKRVITTLKDSVKTDSIVDFSIFGKNIDIAGVKTYNISNSIIRFDKTAVSAADYDVFISKVENANLFIKNFYIKKLPDDATGRVFLRQIWVNLPNYGYAFNFHYEKNDGSLSIIPGVAQDEEFSYFENDYFKVEVDFSVYEKQNLSGEVLYYNGKVYPINIFALKDFVSVYSFNNTKVQTENNTATISFVKKTVDKAFWNDYVLFPTTNSNMMAKFKSLFKVSSPANVLKGEIGTLVDLSTHEFIAQEWFVTKFIKVKPNTTYSVSNTTYIQEFDDNFIFIASSALASSWSNCTFTTKSNTAFVRVVTVYTASNVATTQQAIYMNEGDTVIKQDSPQDEIEGNIIGQLMDGSVGEEKLSPELQQKINLKSSSDLSSYTMYSIGDSMSAANKWQAKVVELTSIQWSAERNIMGGSPLSVGGTNTAYGLDSGLMRTWNLVKNGYIQGDGENTVVIFQNVNDGKQIFAPTSKIFTPTQIIEGYNESNWGETLLGNITPKYGTIIKLLRTGVIGKNLSVTKLPTKAGNVTLKVGWSGPGIKNYNIAVTASETAQSILDKILEWQYDGITDSLSANGTSVDFSIGATDNNYPITVQFIDTDNTGMEVNIVDTNNASTSVPKYFFGDNLDTWTDTDSWKSSLTWSEAFMASIEMIQRNYPKAKICVAIFPRHHAIPNDYKRPDGTFDTNKWLTTDQWEMDNNERVAELEKLCNYYSINSVDVDKHCNISLNNYSTYYPDGNIHPNNTGYMRIGEVVASKFKEIL